MWYPFPSISKESPLNSAVVAEILLCLYKPFVSYDRAKTEKIGNFFVLTWLIFTGPVTYIYVAIDKQCTLQKYQDNVSPDAINKLNFC